MKPAGKAVRPVDGGRGFVLDSHALLAYFEGEASGVPVRALLHEAEQRRVRLYLNLTIGWNRRSRSCGRRVRVRRHGEQG